MSEFQLPVFFVFILSAVLSFILNKFSLKLRNTNKEREGLNEIRLSKLKIPTYGGISMSLAFLISTRLLGKADYEIEQIAIFSVFITLIGFFDDKFNLNWKLKLLLQVLAISTPILILGIYLNIEVLLGVNFNNGLNLVATIFWIVLLVNSLNFLDNMDGLAATTGTMIAISLAILSYISNQYKLTDISLVLMASMLGFLYFNLPNAKLYMGDSGSLFIGYCLGFISILFSWSSNLESSWVFQIQPVILFFTIPVLDFSTVFISRIKEGKSPMTGGTDHISHRLLNKGFNTDQVLIIFVFMSILILIITMGIIFLNQTASFLLLILYFLLVILSLMYFLKLDPLN
jgi:UDP-GlcNAc:undecaprenyl-phosphate GlcNAc-1-phosphate transferase|tara:strand:- start:4337 stop:5371 length:1035 start_codon:yes stop_codon:yes gene_type:complete